MGKIEQKVVNLSNMEEINKFYFVPGSIDSLSSHVKEGWLVRETVRDYQNKKAVILFQKETNSENIAIG